MKYRLWDTDINRLFGTFDNEDEALILARILISSYGDAYADDLALGCEQLDGSFTLPVSGGALIARAQRVASARENVSSLTPAAHPAAKSTSDVGDDQNTDGDRSKTARRKIG